MLAAGARGFVRFAEEGDSLLVTDAAARCQDGGEALCAALCSAGFACRQEGSLLYLAPDDALLEQLCALRAAPQVDWESALHPVQAFASRILRAERTAMTPEGRAFVLRTAALLWQPEHRVLAGIAQLRQQAAIFPADTACLQGTDRAAAKSDMCECGVEWTWDSS